MKAEDYMSGLTFPSGSGSNLVGFVENSTTHPYAVAAPWNNSLWESDAYPRAIID
jgi:hypothetical protein